MAIPLEYQLELAGHRLLVHEVEGREALSEPFRFDVRCHLPGDVALDPDVLMRAEAALVLHREGPERRISGVVTEASITEVPPGTDVATPALHLRLEPRLALAGYRRNTKAFVHKRVTDIVPEVLGELAIAHRLQLTVDYPVRPYTVQYQETDLHFVSRMLEEEGLFYWFDEVGMMVIADDASAYEDAGSLPFRHGAGADRNEDAIFHLGGAGVSTAGEVQLRDWTADAPSRPMDVQAAGPRPGPTWYDFPGEYVEPGAGRRIANRMAEALAVQARQYAGESSAARLAPGRRHLLQDAPVGLTDGRYTIIAVEHQHARADEGVVLRYRAIDGDTTFRSPILHPEPVLPQPVIGKVTGPPGADIHTDELGRVKVHFTWDRLQPRDDTCSHWVPVLQDNLASSVSVPRVGWEVLVHFLEGDPDRPVVLGRVFNGEDRVHLELPANKTRTALRSLSSPSREGFNYVEFEDKAGVQQIVMHAQRDQDVVVVHDQTAHVRGVENHRVKRDETLAVGRDETVDVTSSDDGPNVRGDRTVEVGGDRERETATVDTLAVEGNRTMTIGGDHRRRIGVNDKVAAGSLSHAIGGLLLETSLASQATNADQVLVSAVGGLSLEVTAGSKAEAGGRAAVDVTGAVSYLQAKKTIQTEAKERRVSLVGGAHKTKAQKQITVSGAQSLLFQTLLDGTLIGNEEIAFEVGSSRLTLKEGQITFSTKTSIRSQLSEESLLGAEKSSQIGE